MKTGVKRKRENIILREGRCDDDETDERKHDDDDER